ncbi:MAG: hypothetical protein ABW007_07880 [Chitinophagaceae bacterium]
MKLPNWFKIIWWVLLLVLTGCIMLKRFKAVSLGLSNPFDIFIFIIFIALALVPIFSEMEFLGIKLKQEIEEFKRDIQVRLGDIKNEIKNSQTQTLNQTIQTYGPPPADSKLPEIENEIERIVKDKLKESGLLPRNSEKNKIEVPQPHLELFKIRYSIEIQLRRISGEYLPNNIRPRHQPLTLLIRELASQNVISNELQHVLHEMLSICNYAIHGESVTQSQVKLVTDYANEIIEILRRL